jgi:thiamine biosynthesis lipoprotein
MKTSVGVFVLGLATIAGSHLFVSAGASHAVRYLMGTWCDLTVLDGRAHEEAAEAAFQEIARLERVLSSWDAESELSQLNAKAGRGAQPVSADLATVAAEAQELCETTGGAFDASVAPLVEAWGFFTESPSKPSPARARDAASRVGCDRIGVRRDPPSIALASGSALDFGGIGKGYAVDRALAILRARGVTRAKLDFGSSSLGFIGEVDGGWPIVVADPRDRDKPLLGFRIEQGTVSSSGQRERSFVAGGHRYGHIFDPRTGAPVESRLLVISVVAPKASTSDGLSTALFVMGAEQGARLVSRMPDVSAVFVEERPGHDLVITTAGRVDRLTRLSH